MAVALPPQRDQPGFPLVGGRQRRMATLAGDRPPAASDPDEAGRAEPGARADYHLGCIRDCGAAADLTQVGGAEHRQRIGLGGEVVHWNQAPQGEAACQAGQAERPVDIDHPDLVTPDGCRDGDNGLLRAVRGGQATQIGGQEAVEPGKLPVAEDLDGTEVAGGAGERAARVGSADVRDHPAHPARIHAKKNRPWAGGGWVWAKIAWASGFFLLLCLFFLLSRGCQVIGLGFWGLGLLGCC